MNQSTGLNVNNDDDEEPNVVMNQSGSLNGSLNNINAIASGTLNESFGCLSDDSVVLIQDNQSDDGIIFLSNERELFRTDDQFSSSSENLVIEE